MPGLDLLLAVDPLGRIASIRDRAVTSPMATYADAGPRMISRSLSSGLSSRWSYDPNARLNAMLASIPGVPSAVQIAYESTPAGLKTAANRPELAKSWTYRYDRNGRIINEAIRRTDTEINPMRMSTDYTIDPTLNYRSVVRTVQDTAGITAQTSNTTVNNRNQYTSYGTLAPAYDPNGNLTRLNGTALQYDINNHLTKAVTPTRTTIESLYAASGRKVREKISTASSTTTTDSMSLGPQVVEEYRDGKLAMRYVHGRQIDEIVRAEIDGTTIFPIQDELGNVLALTDKSGKLLERYEYDGYGHVQISAPTGAPRPTSALGWKRLFQGRDYQPALNAYDFRARTLWPDLGRFGQEDPAGAIDHTNLSQALLGDWAGNADPSGEVVVMMHGIRDNGAAWASVVGQGLGEQWSRDGADPGQDAVNLVNRQSTDLWFPCGCEAGEFGFHNAARSLLFGYLDADTRRAADNVALRMNQLRAMLNASKTRIGEPLQVLAHSHGTAILLAAARLSTRSSSSSMTWFHLENAVLAGSDLEPSTNLGALLVTAKKVHSFYSNDDEAVGIKQFGVDLRGGGGAGFLRSDPSLTQTLLPGIRHTGDPLARQYGSVPWMSRQLAMRQYASIFAIYEPRGGEESASWLQTYDGLRRMMGLSWTVRLSRAYLRPYAGKTR